MFKFRNLVVLSLMFVISFAYSAIQDDEINAEAQADATSSLAAPQFSNIMQDVGLGSYTSSTDGALSLTEKIRQPSIMTGKLRNTMTSPEKQL